MEEKHHGQNPSAPRRRQESSVLPRRRGRFIEEIGTYDPLTEPATIKIDMERAKYWIANGAQPTDTVRGLLKKAEA